MLYVENKIMLLGKIVGTVVSTKKDEKLEGLKLHIVQCINVECKPTGAIVIAVDSVGAGVNEIVLIASGSSARQTNITKDKPVDAVIMAIVDILEIDGVEHYVK
jgi:microcompartment protein CcmK/EutM